MRLRITALTLCCVSLAEPDVQVGKFANGQSVNCSTRTECLALLRDVTAMRHQKEAEAYSMLGYADKALRQASSAEGLAKASLAETEDTEAEAVRWSTKVQELEDRLRSAQQDVAKSAAAAQDAKIAEKRAEAAQAEAIREKKHQSALSSEPAKERCLEDFASCTAGLAVLQLEQWMAMLHINRFFVSLSVMAVGTGLLLLPARAQAASFAVCALVVLPVLLAGAFREFLRFVASSPPSELLGSVAGLLTAVLAFAFLWQGADGLRLLLGAALAVLLGDLVLVASRLPLPEALAALAAMALGYAGAAAGLYRRRATQAFAMAVPAALLLPAGCLLFLEALGRSEAYLEDIVSALLPWADKHSEKVVGSTFCEYGRLAWLLLQLPALVHLLTAPGMDVAPFPWESEEPAKSAVVQEASPPEEPEETETNAVQAAEAVETQPEVAVTPVPSIPSQPAVPEPELEKLDPVATTELLQKTVAALQALETALSPKSSQARASEAPPATILAAAPASAASAASAVHGAEGEASNEQ